MRFVLVCSALLMLAACSTPGKKHYPEMDEIAAKLQVYPAWVAPVGEVSLRRYSPLQVLVQDNKLYVANALGEFAALQATDGALLWLKKLPIKFSAGPVVQDALLVFATENGEVLALDTVSGAERWRSQLSTMALANPVIAKDRVYVQTIDDKLFALDADTGQQVWVTERETPSLTLHGTGRPVVDGDVVYAGFSSGVLVALNALTGKPLWEATIAVPSGRTDLERLVDIDGLFQAHDGELYVVSYQGRIAAIDEKEGGMVWTREMSSYTGVALDQEQLYVTDAEGQVWALDRKTGATLWRQDKLKARDLTYPVVLERSLVIADGSGMVHWLSKEDGELLARQEVKPIHEDRFMPLYDTDAEALDFAVTVAPQLDQQTVYVRDNAGDLIAFRILDKTASNVKQ